MSDSSLTPLRIQCLKIHNKEVGETVGSIKWKLVLLYVILVVFVIIISGVYIVVNIQQSAYNDTYKEDVYKRQMWRRADSSPRFKKKFVKVSI